MKGKNVIVVGRRLGKQDSLVRQMKEMGVEFTIMDREDEISALKKRIKELEILKDVYKDYRFPEGL